MKAPAKKKKPAPTYERIPDGQKVMALDVSSSAAGWALGESVNGKIVIHKFGRIKPPAHWDADRRIEQIVEKLKYTCIISRDEGKPLYVTMERQSHMRAAKARNINGLAVLGRAQGAVWWQLREDCCLVEHVSEREWTKEKGWPVSKEKRADKIRMLVPDYAQYVKNDPSLDSGLDISDALGILIWRLTR